MTRERKGGRVRSSREQKLTQEITGQPEVVQLGLSSLSSPLQASPSGGSFAFDWHGLAIAEQWNSNERADVRTNTESRQSSVELVPGTHLPTWHSVPSAAQPGFVLPGTFSEFQTTTVMKGLEKKW